MFIEKGELTLKGLVSGLGERESKQTPDERCRNSLSRGKVQDNFQGESCRLLGEGRRYRTGAGPGFWGNSGGMAG